MAAVKEVKAKICLSRATQRETSSWEFALFLFCVQIEESPRLCQSFLHLTHRREPQMTHPKDSTKSCSKILLQYLDNPCFCHLHHLLEFGQTISVSERSHLRTDESLGKILLWIFVPICPLSYLLLIVICDGKVQHSLVGLKMPSIAASLPWT